MTLTLTENIEATDRVIGVTGTVPDDIGQGYRFRLDDELLELTTFGRQEVQGPVSRQQDPYPNVWLVRRAVDGIAASHTAGAAILGAIDAYVAAESGTTPPEPFASGGAGGGGLPTGWTQDGITGIVRTAGQDFDVGAGILSASRLTLGVERSVTVIAIDPTSGDGLAAEPGSLALRTNGQAWLKTGAGNTDWTQIGGSPAGAIQVVRVPIAFDTPNLVLTGITAYTPTAGDVLLDTSFLTVSTAWDGTTPCLSLYSTGDIPGSGDEIIHYFGLGTANSAQGSSTHNSIVTATMANMYLNASGGNHISLDDTAPLKLMVDDGAAGDPESAQGEGVFVLIIAPAS